MKQVKLMTALTLLSLALLTGCSKDKTSDATTTSDGVIKDEVGVYSVSDGKLSSELGSILNEDGYTGSISNVPLEEKSDVLSNDTVYFSYNSSEITPEMKFIIDKHSSFLKKHNNIKVVLEGHTDERGSNAYNVVLGEKRAQSIKDVILQVGIPDTQVEIISYGESRPNTAGGSEENWAKDRRAVFTYQ
jgi:peptidoglycan-associated lipoprotein